MKKILTFILCCCIYAGTMQAQQQNPANFHPCGSPAHKHEWLKRYQQDPSQFAHLQRNSPTITYLPVTLHLLANNSGNGRVGLDYVLDAFCQLNEDYLPANIQFFIEYPILYENDDIMYDHDSVLQGGMYMVQHNVSNTVNVYFVSSPAGNCGYNLPYAGIAMNNGCLGGHTWAHEMGHQLSLPHTFFGWEGGVSWDNSIQPDFNHPAPTRVTYNYTYFKDTMYTDTLIIDTAYVEYVIRSGGNANCSFAADGFCDTEPDYLAYRWQCNLSTARSTVRQLDPDSVAFYSDGHNIMSYSYDECQTQFSTEQMNAMNSFILSERSTYLYNQNPIRDTIASTPTLLEPSTLTVPENQVHFRWNAVAGATHYLIEVYREPYSAGQVIEKLVVTDTFYNSPLTYAPRPAIFPYAWHVYPFNQGYTCGDYSALTHFNTQLASGVPHLSSDWALQVFPIPTPIGQNLTIECKAPAIADCQLSVYNTLGQRIVQQQTVLSAGNNTFTMDTQQWNAGIYVVECKTPQGTLIQKVILQ